MRSSADTDPRHEVRLQVLHDVILVAVNDPIVNLFGPNVRLA
jgi:hypothetical protein